MQSSNQACICIEYIQSALQQDHLTYFKVSLVTEADIPISFKLNAFLIGWAIVGAVTCQIAWLINIGTCRENQSTNIYNIFIELRLQVLILQLSYLILSRRKSGLGRMHACIVDKKTNGSEYHERQSPGEKHDLAGSSVCQLETGLKLFKVRLRYNRSAVTNNDVHQYLIRKRNFVTQEVLN